MPPMNQRPWCVTVALAVAQAIAHGTAVGQQRDDELETVTIVARVPRALAATEANVAALRADRIEERLAVDLRDLARYEPSLSVRGDATRFGDDSISIRGIGGNRIRIETDGVPRPSAFAVGNFANAGRALSELDFVRQIEILRGPASATYGSSAIGGVIASSTLDPVDLVRDDARIAARVRMLYASDDHGLTVSGIAAGRSDRIEWLAGARRRDAGELQNSWTVLDASRAPSGANATCSVAAIAGRQRLSSVPSAAFHSTSAPSWPLVAKRSPRAVAERGCHDNASAPIMCSPSVRAVSDSPANCASTTRPSPPIAASALESGDQATSTM